MNIRMHSMWKRFLFLCLTTAYMFVVRCTGWFGYGAAAQYVKKVSRKRKSKLTQTPVTASLSSSLISPNALSAPSPGGSIPPPPYDLSRHCQAPSPRARRSAILGSQIRLGWAEELAVWIQVALPPLELIVGEAVTHLAACRRRRSAAPAGRMPHSPAAAVRAARPSRTQTPPFVFTSESNQLVMTLKC